VRFYQSLSSSLIYDFEMVGAAEIEIRP